MPQPPNPIRPFMPLARRARPPLSIPIPPKRAPAPRPTPPPIQPQRRGCGFCNRVRRLLGIGPVT